MYILNSRSKKKNLKKKEKKKERWMCLKSEFTDLRNIVEMTKSSKKGIKIASDQRTSPVNHTYLYSDFRVCLEKEKKVKIIICQPFIIQFQVCVWEVQKSLSNSKCALNALPRRVGVPGFFFF